VTTMLLRHGLEPRFLKEAVEGGNLDVVRALLDSEADPMQPDENGVSAMDVALQRRVVDNHILDALREKVTVVDTDAWDTRGGPDFGKRFSDLASLRSRTRGDPEDMSGSRSWSKRLKNPQVLMRRVKRGTQRAKTKVPAFFQQVYEAHMFQAMTFSALIAALFLPDVWELLEGRDESLDIYMIALLAWFVLEFFVQVVAYHRHYVGSFFFFMDIVGTASIILDLSRYRKMLEGTDKSGSGSSDFGNTVVMRAARAARIGARAGRFGKLVKMLRFLPGYDSQLKRDESRKGMAKAMGRALVTQVSTRVSCLIIFMATLMRIFSGGTIPVTDWSLEVWASQLAHLVAESAPDDEIDVMIAKCLDFFAPMSHPPYRVLATDPATGDVRQIWRGALDESRHPREVTSGMVTILFDFAEHKRVEATTNVAALAWTIFLMMGFSMVISKSINTIALGPLQETLEKVRCISSAIYNRVENIHLQMRSWPVTADPTGNRRMPAESAEDQMRHETYVLERVIAKLGALSEITCKQAGPQDTQTLQYVTGTGGADMTESGTATKVGSAPTVDSFDACALSEGMVSKKSVTVWEEEIGFNSWDFSPLEFGVPLRRDVAIYVLSEVSRRVSQVSEDVITAFVDETASRYLVGPQYHNWAHAVDVTHTLFAIFNRFGGGMNLVFSWMEELALLVGAVAHDVGHPGVNNDFLVQTSHELAIVYNDTAPLEMMHCATLFEILRNPAMDVFAMLTPAQRKEVRSIAIEAILHTDNVQHTPLVRATQMFGEVNSEILETARQQAGLTIEAPDGQQANAWPTRELAEALWSNDVHPMLRNMILHFADISNPVKPFFICQEWANCVLEEFFSQGDKLQELGLPVPALLDRKKTNKPFSQVSFIEFFVAPCVFAVARVFAPLRCLQEEMCRNAEEWSVLWREGGQEHTEEEVQSMTNRIRKLNDRAGVNMARQSSLSWQSDLRVELKRRASQGSVHPPRPSSRFLSTWRPKESTSEKYGADQVSSSSSAVPGKSVAHRSTWRG